MLHTSRLNDAPPITARQENHGPIIVELRTINKIFEERQIFETKKLVFPRKNKNDTFNVHVDGGETIDTYTPGKVSTQGKQW